MVRWPKDQDGVTARQLACLPLAHPQRAEMFSECKGTSASSLSVSSKTYDLHVRTSHPLQHWNGFHSYPFSSNFSLFFTCFPLESHNTFLAQANR